MHLSLATLLRDTEESLQSAHAPKQWHQCEIPVRCVTLHIEIATLTEDANQMYFPSKH